MAKLAVKIAVAFTTGPLIVHNHETGREDEFKGNELLALFEKADPQEFGFELVWIEGGDASTYFAFGRASGKKGALIEFAPKSDASGLDARVEGKFEVKLRAGVAPSLLRNGEGPDFRLRAATHKGGEWSGFSAYLVEFDRGKKDYTILPRVSEFSIK